MRRLQSPLPSFLTDKPPAADPSAVPDTVHTSCELKTLTPVIGGGVKSFEPDDVDVVRVPTIRGHLRWWWRLLYEQDTKGADELFQDEVALWGGVEVPAGNGRTESKTSWVRLRVEVLDAGKGVAAGRHKNRDGKLQTAPRWDLGRELGYALFPLQRTKDERRNHRRTGDLLTRSVRTDLRFRLHLTFRGPEPDNGLEPSATTQVLASLWAWSQLGGLGGRTRRGFGALAMTRPPGLPTREESTQNQWSELLQGPSGEGVAKWLRTFHALAQPQGYRWLSSLLVGRAKPEAQDAHKELVGLLRDFRQGKNVGRDPGANMPGQSRWPEAHLLRLLRGAASYEHPPTDEARQDWNNQKTGAPRAAFGMPIQIQFKGRDSLANATLVPADGGQRWASPLLLRPIHAQNGRVHPVVMILGGEQPAKVEVRFDQPAAIAPAAVKVKLPGGARNPISSLLGGSGDALEAFSHWLREDHGYHAVTIP